MANIKLGGGIIDIRGSMAGNCFARNRFGNYMRAKTKPVNPNSTNQAKVRSIVAMLSQYWHDTMTAPVRATWDAYAAAVAMKNRLGETVYLTGFNMFIRYCTIYNRQTGLMPAVGPAGTTLPEKDPTLSMTALVSDQSIHVAFNDAAPWRSITGSQMIMWLGQPQTATRNFFAGPWKLAGGISAINPTPKTIAAPYTLVLGQKVWAYGRICTGPTDCRLSEPMVISCLVTAAP